MPGPSSTAEPPPPPPPSKLDDPGPQATNNYETSATGSRVFIGSLLENQ